MSDYPRPGREAALKTRLFPPDGLVALVYIVLLVITTALWLIENARRWGSQAMSGFQAYRGFFELCIGFLMLGVAALWWMARGRVGGFVAVLLIAGWMGGVGVVRQNHLSAGLSLLLAGYALVRLSGRYGPRPIRRRDLGPR